MCRADQLDAALGDRPGRLRFQLGADLVDDDDLGHVVLDSLDHHLVLERRGAHLHPSGLADGRVGDVAVARDLVAGVHDDDALAEVVGEDAGRLAQHRGLADPRAAHDEDRLPGVHEVADDLDRPVDGPADPAGEADDLAAPVPDGADPVERALDAGPVVVAEGPDLVHDLADVRLGDLAVEERHLAVGEARLGPPAEVHHHLDQVGALWQGMERGDDLRRERREERLQVVDRFATCDGRPRWDPSADGRHQGRLGDADERLLDQERDGGDRGELLLLEAVAPGATRRSAPGRSRRAGCGASRAVRAAMTPRPKRTSGPASAPGRTRIRR